MQLKAENIDYYYKEDSYVLKDVNLKIDSGEVVGLYGPSGYGKTTLAKILSGYIKETEGRVSLGDKEIVSRGYNPVQLIFQHPEKTVNPRWKIEKTLNEGWKVDDETLKKLGIKKEWLNRWPNELSGGELQRFCIARALGPETRFLIADEISTMLDSITQAQIWNVVLQEVKKRKLGVLVISHDRDLVNRICDRLLDLRKLNKK